MADHAYVTVDYLQGTGGLNFTGTTTRAWVLGVIQSVSDLINGYINTDIHPTPGTRYYDGDSGTALEIGNLISVTSLKEDNSMDGTFDTTWASTDFILAPYNSDPTSVNGSPHRRIEVSPYTNGTQDVFLRGRRNYELVGTFGYVGATQDTGQTASADHATAATSIDIGASASGNIEVGWTLVLGTPNATSEQIFVTDTSGTSITVKRGVNDSVAGSFGSGDALNRFVYPSEIEQAAAMQSARIYSRRQSSFATEIGNAQTGAFTRFSRKLDEDVALMLASYRRIAI
jgi:hypothetical protein